jgi:hypothetical protein
MSQYLAGEFITRMFRISGEADVQSDPLLDLLNDHLALFIQLERMFISPLHHPAVLVGNYEVGNVRKDRLVMAVLKRESDGLPYRRAQYEGRDHVDRKLVIVTAGFELQGLIRLHPSVNVSHFIRTTSEQFIPLFQAQASLVLDSSTLFKGEAILVNRAQIEAFSYVGR